MVRMEKVLDSTLEEQQHLGSSWGTQGIKLFLKQLGAAWALFGAASRGLPLTKGLLGLTQPTPSCHLK